MVRLSNAADMTLVRRQLMRPEEVRWVEADAIVDTGAVTFVLLSLVVERLGLAWPFKQGADRQSKDILTLAQYSLLVGVKLKGLSPSTSPLSRRCRKEWARIACFNAMVESLEVRLSILLSRER
jgi:hypothetical protein